MSNGAKLKAFPVAWVTTGRRLLIVGGGPETATRLRHALMFDWQSITMVIASSTDELNSLARTDTRVAVHERDVLESDVRNADIVMEDSGDAATGQRLQPWCKAHCIPLNSTDKSDLCDFYYVSFLVREPLTISIGSGGEAPAVTAALRRWLEDHVGPGWASAARLLSDTRRQLPGGQARMDLLKGLARNPDFLERIDRNDEAGLRKLIDHAIDSLRT